MMKQNLSRLLFFILLFSVSPAFAVDPIPYNQADSGNVTIVKEVENKDNIEYKVTQKVNVNDYIAPLCLDVPLVFTTCIQSICIEKSPIGTLYKEIKGLDTNNNTCHYQEYTKGFGGLDCHFQNDILKKVETLQAKKSSGASDPTKKLTDEEISALKRINETSCKVLSDSDLQAALPLDKSTTPAPPVQPKATEQPTSAPKEATEQKADTSTTTTTETKASSTEEISPEQAQYKSIMFTDQEIALIGDSLRAFKAGTTIAGTGGAKAEPQIRSYHLNTIIYKSKEQWAVWLNNKRITSDEADGLLKIDNVSEYFITVRWLTNELDQITPDWRRKLILVGSNKYKARPEDGNIQVEVKDQTAAVVSFRLAPNQTFDVNGMKIKEGD